MRIIVTGGAGFIGSHLCERLLADGHRVAIIDNFSTGTQANVNAISQTAHTGKLLIRRGELNSESLDFCEDWLVGFPDVIFHLAATVGVNEVLSNAVKVVASDVSATVSVLDAAVAFGAKVIFTSTSEVYGKSDALPFREDGDLVLGASSIARWGYAAAKLLEEHLCMAYGREKGLRVVIPRLFNTIGPRQSGRYGMVVPRFVQQALAGEPLTVYGDGQQSRCFCDVADVVEGLIRLMVCPDAEGQIVNMGSTREIQIIDLALQVMEQTRRRTGMRAVSYSDAYGPGFEDMRRRVPDLTKAERLIGWQPEVKLETTIQRVIDYQRAELIQQGAT